MGVLHTDGSHEVKLQGCKVFPITPSNTLDIKYPGAALHCNGDMTLAIVCVDDDETVTQYNQSMGTGDGVTNNIGTGSITHYPVKANSIIITDGLNNATDDGNDNIIGDATGTIDKVTGALTIKWKAGHIPAVGVSVLCSYHYSSYTPNVMKFSKGDQPYQVRRVYLTSTDLGGELLFGVL